MKSSTRARNRAAPTPRRPCRSRQKSSPCRHRTRSPSPPPLHLPRPHRNRPGTERRVGTPARSLTRPAPAPATMPAETRSASLGSAPPAMTAPLVPPRPVAGTDINRAPTYPEIARRRGDQGRVILRVSVSAEGTPLAVELKETSGHLSLDAAAPVGGAPMAVHSSDTGRAGRHRRRRGSGPVPAGKLKSVANPGRPHTSGDTERHRQPNQIVGPRHSELGLDVAARVGHRLVADAQRVRDFGQARGLPPATA